MESKIDYNQLANRCFELKMEAIDYFPEQEYSDLEYPYSKEKLSFILTTKNIQIPQGLFDYLTTVSSEFVLELFYPTNILESSFPNKTDTEQIVLNEPKITNHKIFYKACIVLVRCGCGKEVLMYLGNGKQYGTIWYDDPNNDEVVKIHESIEEYIIHQLKYY